VLLHEFDRYNVANKIVEWEHAGRISRRNDRTASFVSSPSVTSIAAFVRDREVRSLIRAALTEWDDVMYFEQVASVSGSPQK